MRIYLKCQYCHHAVGTRLDLRGRHRDPEEGQTWSSIGYESSFDHLLAPYQITPLGRHELTEIYHSDCKETYSLWSRFVWDHKMFCHEEGCLHSPPYPFHHFNLPFSGTPTTLGEPIPIPEEVKRLLRL